MEGEKNGKIHESNRDAKKWIGVEKRSGEDRRVKNHGRERMKNENQRRKMDIETLNYLGYGEVIEISLWLAVMYAGKGFIDEFFNRRLK